MHFDLIPFIRAVGHLGVFAIIFAESGLLIGFFFPGDSLIFTAGFLASQGFLNITALAVGSFVAAVAGDSTGYVFGKKVGPALFTKEDSLFFDKRHLENARVFYEKHGGKTIILARFIPIVRTFAPILAGVGKMRYRTFLSYNIIGGFVWTVGISYLGYFLGNIIPNADRYVLPIVIMIIIVSILPNIIHLVKDRETRRQLWHFLRRRGRPE